MDTIRVLFSKTGLIIVAYVIIGIFANTASPHLPTNGTVGGALIHSWIQYFISVVFWPLSLWHPLFNVGKWTGH